MTVDLKDFWRRFQSGLDIAVASDLPDKLLGVRDAFQRYLQDGLGQTKPISVKPRPAVDEADVPLPLDDAETLELARRHARGIDEGEDYAFRVGVELGLETVESRGDAPPGGKLETGGESRSFVRCWSVVLGLGQEAWGSSGSIQLPERLIRGLDHQDLPFAIPGTRRRGGMVSSLTSGLETRRTVAALATFHALSTLMYSVVEHRRRR